MALTFHHFSISTFFSEVQHFKDIPVIAGFDSRCAFNFSEMIYAKIVCDTHSPWKKLSFFCIAASADGIDDLDQYILENVFRQILVFNQKKNGSVKLILMTKYECF